MMTVLAGGCSGQLDEKGARLSCTEGAASLGAPLGWSHSKVEGMPEILNSEVWLGFQLRVTLFKLSVCT